MKIIQNKAKVLVCFDRYTLYTIDFQNLSILFIDIDMKFQTLSTENLLNLVWVKSIEFFKFAEDFNIICSKKENRAIFSSSFYCLEAQVL